MSDSVKYVQVVKTDSGKYVYEARDGSHRAVETSKEYAKEAAAHQAGADAYTHEYDENGNVVSLGVPVRHAVVSDGRPEYGDDDEPGPGTVQ
jgi:hypothetical protein